MALMNFLDVTPPNQQPMTQTETGSTEEEESTEDIAQHQDFSPHFFEYEDDRLSFTGTSSSDTDEEPASDISKPTTKQRSYRDDIPDSLKKPFRDPRKKSNSKKGHPTANPHTPERKRSPNEVTPNTSRQTNSNNPNQNTNGNQPNLTTILDPQTAANDLFNLKFKATKIYTSKYLDDAFKPSPNSISLAPELEPLLPLISSQHEAFSQYIKDLSTMNLTHTKTIEKKRASFLQLKEHKKIPRSLRIKVELSTTPAYSSQNDFVRIRDNFKTEVSNFINKTTELMTEWAEINIELLNIDRCSCIINKALQILKGLVSFYADIIGMPSWPSTENTQKNAHTSLLLLKLYLSNSYLQTKEIAEYLDTTPEKILTIATKNLMNLDSDEEANNLLNTLNISDFDTNNDLQKAFVSETLLNFDQILRICLLDIWRFNEGKTRQATAALNLKLAMRSSETKDITASTALAIDKAAENVAKAQLTNLKTNLRLSNLEKAVRTQENRSGEIINQMKSNAKKTQKNYTGSRSQGPAASLPHTSALTQNKQRYTQYKHNNATEHNSSKQPPQETETRPGNKRKRREQENYKKDLLLQNSQSPPPKKTIQWSESETRSFNPSRPVSSSLTTTTFATSPLFTQGTAWNPSHYPTALPPTYIAAPPPNYTTTVDGLHTPYHNQAYPGYHPQPPLFQQQHQWNNQRQILFHPHTENKKKNPFSN